MGGDGSGRHPSEETIIKRLCELKTPIVSGGIVGSDMFLPNHSGIAVHPEFKEAVGDYVPYTGATTNVNLGSKTLTTTGTITAEQLTSTDDITMAGKLTNTMSATDIRGLEIIQAGYTGGVSDTDTAYLQRTISSSGGGNGLDANGIINNLTNNNATSGSTLGTTSQDTTGIQNIISEAGSHSRTNVTFTETENGISNSVTISGTQNGSGFTNTTTGETNTITNNRSYSNNGQTYTQNSIGVSNSVTDNSFIEAGTLNQNNYGTKNVIASNSFSMGAALNVANYGEYISITDGGFGTSTSYGIYINAIGGTTNYALYNNTAVNSFMGNDNAKTLYGTGKDASIYYDGTDLVIKSNEVGSGTIKLNASSNWTANGTNTVTISNVAPAGVGTATISKWLTLKDDAGTIYYIPAFT